MEELVGLAPQQSEIQLEESIKPAGNISSISNNKHSRMASSNGGGGTDLLGKPVVSGKKLSLRLANLKVFQMSNFSDIK